MNIVDAPALTAEQFADIRIALEAEHSDWRPSGQPTGITYTDIFCGFGSPGSSGLCGFGSFSAFRRPTFPLRPAGGAFAAFATTSTRHGISG